MRPPPPGRACRDRRRLLCAGNVAIPLGHALALSLRAAGQGDASGSLVLYAVGLLLGAVLWLATLAWPLLWLALAYETPQAPRDPLALEVPQCVALALLPALLVTAIAAYALGPGDWRALNESALAAGGRPATVFLSVLGVGSLCALAVRLRGAPAREAG